MKQVKTTGNLPMDGMEIMNDELMFVTGGAASQGSSDSGCECEAGKDCGCDCPGGKGCGCGCDGGSGCGCGCHKDE